MDKGEPTMSALAIQPRAIESQAEYDEYLSATRELLLDRNRTHEETRLLKTLSILIKDYEQHRYPEMFAKAEPKDILRFLLEENQMAQTDIPGIPQSRISDILTGRRGISVSQAHRLAEVFGTD